jgi:F-box interacting protein
MIHASFILYNYYFHNDTHCSSYYLLSGERFENRLKLQSRNLFQEENPVFDFFGSAAITGIVLLQNGDTIVLWNPATHEFKVSPPSPAQSVPPYRAASNDVCGFGYTYIKDDFKIIRNIRFERISDRELRLLNVRKEDVPRDEISYDPVWEIYSLKCNSWRKLDMNMPCWSPCAVYESLWIDGICHWWADSENCDEHLLVSFN